MPWSLLRNKEWTANFLRLGQYNRAFVAPLRVRSIKAGGRFYQPRWTEWKRAKWAKPIQAYLKYSEKIWRRHACPGNFRRPCVLESYIKKAYRGLRRYERTYSDRLSSQTICPENSITSGNLGEKLLPIFGPLCSRKIIWPPFVIYISSTKRDLVIICNQEGNLFWGAPSSNWIWSDPRVKFVGNGLWSRPVEVYP